MTGIAGAGPLTGARSSQRSVKRAETAAPRRPLSRRAVVVGAVPVAAAAIGAAGSLAWQFMRSGQSAQQPPEQAAVATPGETLPPAAVSTPRVEASPPIATPSPAMIRTLTNIGIPEGMALVASPRLPVAGVGPEDPWRLLTGKTVDWAALGSPVPLRVRPLGFEGETTSDMRPEQTLAGDDALAAALATDPGAVALAPLEAVDFRVQTLTVGTDDPLRESQGGQRPMRIGVIGDIVPGRNVHLHMEQYGDFTRPFLRVAPLLRPFDVTIANLEGNLSYTLPQPADGHSFSFVSNPAMLDGFALAGIDAVTLANNHSVWNSEGWGLQGLLDTMAALDEYGVPYFGAGLDLTAARAPWIVDAGETRIAFLGIDGVTANYEAAPGAANGVSTSTRAPRATVRERTPI